MTERRVPEGKYVKLDDGRRMHFHEAGQGPPVVFLHGSGPGASGYSNFKGNFPYFAERFLRVFVPDSLGFGYSDKPVDVDYALGLHVEAYRRFLDALSLERVSLVGNSHGGAIALGLALKYPDRVSRLVLMAPGGLEATSVYMQMPGIKAMINSTFAYSGPNHESMRAVFERQLYDPALVTDELIEERLSIAVQQPRHVLATQRVPNLSDRLSELVCPVFGLWGMDDQFCPPSGARTLAEGCADARVLMLTRCGHWVMVEHRDLFNRWCVDFLAE